MFSNLVKHFFCCSYILSFAASWLFLEVIYSDYSWWYWTEGDGLKIWIVLFVSIPLYVASVLTRFIFNKVSKREHSILEYFDILIPLVFLLLLAFLRNDLFAFIGVTLLPLLPFLLFYVNSKLGAKESKRRGRV